MIGGGVEKVGGSLVLEGGLLNYATIFWSSELC